MNPSRDMLKDLADAGKRLGSVTSSAELYQNVFAFLMDALGYDKAAILLKDPILGGLSMAACRGYDEVEAQRLSVTSGQGVIGRALETGETEIAQETIDGNEAERLTGSVSEVAIPLKDGAKTIGIVHMKRQSTRFNENSRLFFMVFGEQVTAAISRIKLQSSLDQRARKLVSISRAGRALTSGETRDRVTKNVLTLAHSALGADGASLQLVDDDTQRLVVVAACGDERDAIGRKTPWGQGIIGTATRTKRPSLVPDASKDRAADAGPQTGPVYLSEMAVPLMFRDELLGALHFGHGRPGRFDETDLLHATIFADQMAVSIGSAHLLNERTQEMRQHEVSLNRWAVMAEKITSEHDLNAVLKELTAAAEGRASFARAAVLIPASDEDPLAVIWSRGYPGGGIGQVDAMAGKIAEEAYRAAAPVLESDVRQGDPAREEINSGRATAAVPLFAAGEVIGVFMVDTDDHLDGAWLKTIEVLAAQIATAVHYTRLFGSLDEANVKLAENVTEMSRLNAELSSYSKKIVNANDSLALQLKNLTTIHEAGKAITSSLDLDHTLATILEMTSQIIGSTAGAIKLLDEDTEEFSTRAASGSIGEVTGTCTVFEVPLKIGDKKIGVFELVCKAENGVGKGEREMVETLASQAAIAIENARLFESTQQIYYDTLKSLASALEARDDYTQGHSTRVADIAKRIALDLGLDAEETKTIYSAALLHDIGKIGIRDKILLAPRKLTEEEMNIIKEHAVFGNTILMPLKFLGQIRECVRHHHERWDGAGYPDGLKGADIPLASRIIAVADTYDAMTSERPYREPIPHKQALKTIRALSGMQFDSLVVDSFVRVIK